MTDLRDPTDEELCSQAMSMEWPESVELARRLAVLRAERDEAYEDSRRSLDRVNRLIGGLDESKDLLAAAEAAWDAAVKALREIVDRHTRPCGVHEAPLPDDVALAETYGIARAALASIDKAKDA